jgi:hypothetical protein
MPAIPAAAKATTELFNKLKKDAASKGETNDCTVKAICVVTGCSYETAHTMLAARGRKSGRGAFRFDTHAVIRQLGFTMTLVEPEEMQAKYDRKKTGGYQYKQLTTHHLALYPEAWKDGHTYLIHVSAHVAGAIDGTLHDWTVGTARRIQSIYRITRA